MKIAELPRRRYSSGPSPLERLGRLSDLLGGPDIYIKRDDLLGGAGGGNKTRKLEFLIADALAKGADTIITGGAIQSNHCRLTASAAAREGLPCRLVLKERIPGSYDPKASGNNLLYHLLGVERIEVVSSQTDLGDALRRACDAAAAEGRRPYLIPYGGSCPVGAAGYAACAQEVLDQAFSLGVSFDILAHASSSAGTQAGLLAGFAGAGAPVSVVGMSVDLDKDAMEQKVYALAQDTAQLLGLSRRIPREAVQCDDGPRGPGYAVPSREMVEAVKLVAQTEGILLDPVYTGKAMAGLVDCIRKGKFGRGERILFLHTGGSPALYVYADAFFSRES